MKALAAGTARAGRALALVFAITGLGASWSAHGQDAPQKPAPLPSQRYKLPDLPSMARMNIVVVKNDLGDQYRLDVSFTVPAVPTPGRPYPFNLITIYGLQLYGPNRSLRHMLLPSTFAPITGNWATGDPVTFSINVPKEFSDASQGWEIRFCIGSSAVGCLPSANLLTGSPINAQTDSQSDNHATPALSLAQGRPEGPTDAKAQKTFQNAFKYLNEGMEPEALDEFRKADKQDGGHCVACQKNALTYALKLQDWKAAEAVASEMAAQAQGRVDLALAQYQFGVIFMDEALAKGKDELYSQAHGEFSEALKIAPNFPQALFSDGRALGHLNQDDAAKAQFEEFLKLAPANDADRQRVQRYIQEPALARARMAPAFAVTTLDGQHVSLDDLQGKVVLLDFWATWCGPCREALPHIREIAKKLQGQPLVILSVSLDSDREKWKDFVAKNDMTWLNYCDGGFTGPIAKLFAVEAIPHTFTIDSDGVLQDEHIGDASIEGRLKKLVASARELQAGREADQARGAAAAATPPVE